MKFLDKKSFEDLTISGWLKNKTKGDKGVKPVTVNVNILGLDHIQVQL